MPLVKCTCDGGADDNGICPKCIGWGEYVSDEFDPVAWVIYWGVN